MQNLCAVRSSASNIDPVIICIIRMSVPKRQVIGNPSFCLVAFGVVPGRRYTEGLKTATPTKADLIYHTIYAYFQFTPAYINMVPGIAKKLSYCETRRSRVIIFARTRHLLWQFSPVLLSVISCGGEKYAKNLTLSGRAWAEVLWFMRSFNRIVCAHFYFYIRRRKWW